GFAPQLMDAREAQERPNGQADIGGAAVGVAYDGDRAIADETERSFDGEFLGLMEPVRERFEREARQARVALGMYGIPVDLRRASKGVRTDGHVFLAAGDKHPPPPRRRDGWDVPAVVAACPRSGDGAAGKAAQSVGLEPFEGESPFAGRDLVGVPRQ